MQDHLGNVRAVLVKANSGSTDYVVFRDYYPFGMEIAGRNYTDADGYRYGYQGKYAEKDPETGWNAFELRMYDSRVGRWLNVDPAGQYYSPYVGMGNDPVNKVDPDGGTDSESGAWWYRFTHPSWWGASIRQSEKYGDYFLQKGTDNGVKVTFAGQRYNNTGYMPSGFDYGHWANFQKTMISATVPLGLDRAPRINIGGDIVNDAYVGGRTLLSGPLGLSKRGFNDLNGNTVTYDQQTSAGINLFLSAATAGEGSLLKASVEGVTANGIRLVPKTGGWVAKKMFRSLDVAVQKKVISAIENGIVAPTGRQGIIKLTAVEAAETGFTHKIKILGKGGDLRIYGTQGANGHIFFEKIMGH